MQTKIKNSTKATNVAKSKKSEKTTPNNVVKKVNSLLTEKKEYTLNCSFDSFHNYSSKQMQTSHNKFNEAKQAARLAYFANKI